MTVLPDIESTVRDAIDQHRYEQTMSADQALSLIGRAGRAQAPWILDTLDEYDTLSPQAYATVVPRCWTMPEQPETDLEIDRWWDLFERAGFPGRPDEPIRLWRGAISSHARGAAWSSDITSARWFAQRFGSLTGTPGRVWTTMADPQTVMAIIDERGEHEVVCWTPGLGEVTEVHI